MTVASSPRPTTGSTPAAPAALHGPGRRQARAPHPRLPGAARRDAGGLPEGQAAPPRGPGRRSPAGRPAVRRAARGYAPSEPPAHDVAGRHVYYMYTVLAPGRDELRAFLETRRIGTQLIYPKLVPDQGAYATHPWRAADDLSVARSLVPRLLCLPMFAELTGRGGRPRREPPSASSITSRERCRPPGGHRWQRCVHPGADGRHRRLARRR